MGLWKDIKDALAFDVNEELDKVEAEMEAEKAEKVAKTTGDNVPSNDEGLPVAKLVGDSTDETDDEKKESNLVGTVAASLGTAALIWLGYKAVSKFSGDDDNYDPPPRPVQNTYTGPSVTDRIAEENRQKKLIEYQEQKRAEHERKLADYNRMRDSVERNTGRR